mmetsp:Transcript_855/g.1780  ORF Transcript_855/g.1780 Transcript_855/m.1780 type:complete len:631 (+) Transcript_855:316-2208(+)|eukprot:CAMPEP_0197177636 /NCGR_PEP_ID=MMETSP1423-20130617/3168_1 /TAXON_ID=476441 /ORGANISM="Pseudo-nitzschia heimii, Strain UNC1101" /LENGTH=630 /DNA_ID=CAMNT_0042627215 /DNA_START=242 /DNA_END=2134 /DNA_ORIENTATION=+
MSNTTVTIRSGKSGMAPPGRRLYPAADSDDGFDPTGTCASSTCCLGDDEAVLRSVSDDKYRKRSYQRKQQQLRNCALLLSSALCILLYTVYKLMDGDVGHPQHHGKVPGRKKSHDKHKWENEQHHDYARPEFDDEDDDDKEEGNKRRQALDHQNDSDRTNEETKEDAEFLMEQRRLDLHYLEERMKVNTNTTIRWADMRDIPALPGQSNNNRRNLLWSKGKMKRRGVDERRGKNRKYFQVHRPESEPMVWENEWDAIEDKRVTARSDYVNYVHHTYKYPAKLMEPPELGKYPFMRTYKELMDTWPQDNLDNPPDVLQEDLIHFDFNIPADMTAAVKFRDAKLPFKVINVPEVMAATTKWTDEYIAEQFDNVQGGNGPQSNGKCNEGPDNFFAFFNPPLWSLSELGLPPTRDNDFTFARWARHSQYADRVGLHPHQPHFYWQSGLPKEERNKDRSKWTFVSRDLPSFSSTTENFFLFHPELQKGIQCRFGERGITAANHYDGGRNMIAMITGAKRYILSPPRACKRLGIVSSKGHASYRHSMLNYGHIPMMETREDIPYEEKEWLKIAGTAEAVSTVVKEGEVLYVPTGWFHYITSLQKSAQCNVRSGPDMVGDNYWGGGDEINAKCFPEA